jgi:hypothetical protein
MEFGLFCSVKIFSITFNTFRCIYLVYWYRRVLSNSAKKGLIELRSEQSGGSQMTLTRCSNRLKAARAEVLL